MAIAFPSLPGNLDQTARDISRRVDANSPGEEWFVKPTGSDQNNGTGGWSDAKLTIQAAHDAASAGDNIYVAPGDYAEQVTFTKDNLLLLGVGPFNSCAIAPTGAAKTALTIDGTTGGGRVEEVHVVNMDLAGTTTGSGLYAKGNIRRLEVDACLMEGGTGGTAAKLESTGGDPLTVADTRFRDCEFTLADRGLDVVVSGAGDPVTQTFLKRCHFSNHATDGIRVATVPTKNLRVLDCTFEDGEDGTAPTNSYIDAAVAATTGLIARTVFPSAINGGKVKVNADGLLRVRGSYFSGGINTAQPT